jgi:opacity protein-like surface antigen
VFHAKSQNNAKAQSPGVFAISAPLREPPNHPNLTTVKKIILITAFAFPLLLQAQRISSKRLSLYIHGGYLSSNFLHKADHHELVSESETDDHKCITFNAGLQWKISDKWRTGLAFTYDHFGTKHRSLEYSNVSFLLRCDRVWMSKNKFLLYSGAAAGVTKVRKFEYETETDRHHKFAYQINAAGLSYEPFKNFQLEANIGWGVSGLLTAGGRFSF